MKWYPRDPAAAIEGMIGLSPEERGFYNLVIDLLYARDGKGVTDALVCSAMGCRPQVWKRVKTTLLDKGKITEMQGWLMANRVETTLQTSRKLASQMSVLRREQLRLQALKLGEHARKPITIKKDSFYGEKEAGEVSTELLERVGRWNRR